MVLVDYIYLDVNRINSYYEQISGRRRRRFIPTLSFNAGIPPSVGVQIGTQLIDASIVDKYSKVINYLQEEALIRDGRGHKEREQQWLERRADQIVPFRREECFLQTMTIHPQGRPYAQDDMTMWLSECEEPAVEPAPLYLVENYPADGRVEGRISGLTMLAAMAELSYPLRDDTGAYRYHGDTGEHISMLDLLSRLNLHIGPPKLVNVVYRIRMFFPDRYLDRAPSTIGYPIAITQTV